MERRISFIESIKMKEDYKKKLADSLLNIKLIKYYGTEKFELDKYILELKSYQVNIKYYIYSFSNFKLIFFNF